MTSSHLRTLPAEWAPQSAVMLTWPHPHGDWRPWLAAVEPVFVDIARAVAGRQTVLISCFDAAHREQVGRLLAAADVEPERVRLYVQPSNDTWARDHGPITVLEDGRPRLLDFRFNGWGGKYRADLDDCLTRGLHAQGAFGATPLESVDLVLEGGSIESDGQGALLTTSACLLTPTRNPELDRAGVEARLRETLGVERVLWLEHGYLAGDDTDSHVDTLARFCDPHTIAYVQCQDPADEHYAALRAMEQELRALRDAAGRAYRLVPLPMPAPKLAEDGTRLPATYANFLIVNGAVLAPTYEDRADALALERLRNAFPDRDIVAVPCLPLVQQYGSLHCVTMQLPVGVI